MRVAYVTPQDPDDVHHWSGLTYHIARAVERQGVEVVYVGPLRPWQELLFKGKQAFYRYLRGSRHLRMFDPGLTKIWGRMAARRIARLRPDVVLAPGTPVVADLETDVPIVVYSDAVFSQTIGYGEFFSNLNAASIRNGHRQQREALRRAAAVVLSSGWAVDAAEDYGVPRARLHEVPFGASLPELPPREAVERAIDARAARPSPCRLLLLGVEWERKGAARAVEVARLLNEGGLPTTLDIVGCLPPEGTTLPPYVRAPGFISKRTEEGRTQFARLLGESHFLILPTLIDCTPVVFNEAAAYGIPVLTHHVGGVPDVVRDGVNGWALPPEEGAAAFAARVREVMGPEGAYARLARTSRDEYERNLNWDVAGRRLKEILEAVVAERRGGPAPGAPLS